MVGQPHHIKVEFDRKRARLDGSVEIKCSIFMKGIMLPGYKSVMNVMEMGNNVDAMIFLLPQSEAKNDGQPDYIVV